MNLKIKIVIILSIIVILGILSPNFIDFKKTNNIEPTIISDIAYDVNKKLGHTIYINENNIPIPYFVLTNKYNGIKGHVLLLRKNLLDEPVLYSHNYNTNEGGVIGFSISEEEEKALMDLINAGHKINGNSEGIYYKESYMNYYLNNEYITLLDSNLRDDILSVDIPITNYPPKFNNIMQYEIENFNTKIFLLSFAEIFNRKSGVIEKEGNLLKYFKDNGIDTDNLQYSPIFTRSMYHSASLGELVVSFTNDGSYGGGPGFNKLYIRPAFVLPNDIKIKKDSEGRYVLDL